MAAMNRKLEAWLAETGALQPKRNPNWNGKKSAVGEDNPDGQ
jgi:hypothetical protein